MRRGGGRKRRKKNIETHLLLMARTSSKQLPLLVGKKIILGVVAKDTHSDVQLH